MKIEERGGKGERAGRREGDQEKGVREGLIFHIPPVILIDAVSSPLVQV